jgi:Protein of unknown function (DUF3568)
LFLPFTYDYATRVPPTHDTIAMQSVTSRIIVLAIAALPLAGCQPIAISALGGGTSAGVSAGISRTLGGTVSRTFTASLPRVRAAALAALKRMHIDVRSTGKVEGGEEINAKAINRSIDIELEEISPNVTRMSVTAKAGVFVSDSATGAEILLQTDRGMGEP